MHGMSWRVAVFNAVAFTIVTMLVTFRGELYSLPLKLMGALGGAWIILRAYHWMKDEQKPFDEPR